MVHGIHVKSSDVDNETIHRKQRHKSLCMRLNHHGLFDRSVQLRELHGVINVGRGRRSDY